MLSLSVLAAGGCYERTVSARGFGADRVTIQDANSPGPVKKTKVRDTATHKELPAQRERLLRER
jgi:hypothetical protein